MNDRLYKFISNELALNINNIEIVTKLNGLNNLCYKIEYLNKSYFIRIHDSDNNCFTEEKNNIILCSQNNIAPNLYYFSTKTGNMMTEWINGTSPSETQFSSAYFINKLTDKLKILHNLKTSNTFNPFSEIHNNINRCKSSDLHLPSYIDILTDKLDMIESYCLKNIEYGFCHNDLNPSNLILSKDDLYIIDYEFSAMGDIFYDLATLGWMMSNEGRELLLKTYFDNPCEYHYQKLSYYTFIVKFWNASWSLLKSQNHNSKYDYKKGAEIIFEELYKSSFNIYL